MSLNTLLALICVVVSITGLSVIIIDSLRARKRENERLNSLTYTIYSELSAQAHGDLNLSQENLMQLAAGIEITAAAMAKIHGLSIEGEVSRLIPVIADKLNYTAEMKSVVRKYLDQLNVDLKSELKKPQDVTEFLEEVPEEDEEEIIELTELVEEKKPLTHRRWGEVCAPKVPVKPMAPRRWGQVRMMSSVK